MRLTKFPVISPSGAEYRVVVRPTTEEIWRVHLYKRGRFIGWRYLVSGSYVRHDYSAEEAVSSAVREYEERISRKNDWARKFNEWDGRIAE